MGSKTFFGQGVLASRAPLPLLAACGECGLYKTCLSPKMPPSGRGKKKVLIVGEAPGRNEDEQGVQFVGKAGRYLQEVLQGMGVDFKKDCWVTNALICRPPNNKIKNDKAVGYCRPNLIRTIKELDPQVIIPLGKTALKGVIGWLWKTDPGELGAWVGQKVKCCNPNAWVCPTWHPSYLIRMDKGREMHELFFKKHLKEALSLTDRPWQEVPDYKKEIKILFDDESASYYLKEFLVNGEAVAFDFETDRLKPDHPDSHILSCAVSDGNVTVSYPWVGYAIGSTKALLLSNVPKIGWNIKFEDRWCRRVFGKRVKNWVWDGMLAAHTLDNRRGTKSLKFQAFINLGQEDYDSHLDSYKQADSSNVPNRLKEVGLSSLLAYNGLDALLEYKMAQIQMERLGCKL